MSVRTEVGVLGLGVMGSAIAQRLLETGHPVRVYDVRAEAVARLVDAGAEAAETPQDLSACAAVVLSLNTAAIIEQAVFGLGGLLAEDVPGGLLVIDMSSIDPGSTRRFAARAEQVGSSWVDAPLSGGAPAAARGEMTLMLGGRDEQVIRATEILRPLAGRISHIGPHGAGQVAKMVNQVLVGCAFGAVAEAAALVRAAGLEPAEVLTALTGGRADSVLLQEFFTKFAALDLTPTGRISNMVKDLDAAREFARSENVPLPLTAAVSELHRWLTVAGHGDSDNAALMLYYVGRVTA